LWCRKKFDGEEVKKEPITKISMRTVNFVSQLLLLAGCVAAFAQDIPSGYKLLYSQNFESPASFKDFVFSDPAAWRLGKDESGNGCLELFGKSRYTPKHRSPFNIALINGREFGDFIMDVELQSTVQPYNHQDMCLFFGFQSTNQFYYAHLAVRPDPNAHNLFIVNDAPRTNFAAEVSNGVVWGNGWHKVRLQRQGAEIKVFFDSMTKPALVGRNATFSKGFVGFGSFDDKGKIRNVKIYGTGFDEKQAGFFKPAQ